ncbi:MAG: GNAT family N-acetyltransferase [Actinomycetota bacterium]
MPVPDHVHRFWLALDELFARVRPTRWGAVITDGRYPRIWDTNYARIDVADDSLRSADIEAELLPALHDAGASTFHVVSFHPDHTAALLAELSSRGHRLSWDLVMNAGRSRTIGPTAPSVEIEELPPDDELWTSVAASFALFGVDPGEAVEQLRGIERDVLAPGGKRWFVIRDETGAIASLAALLTLEAVGYIDNVATFPHARRRGYAAALTARIVHEARAADAEDVCLFADPDDDAVVRLYRGLGFEEAGRLASTRGPLPA